MLFIVSWCNFLEYFLEDCVQMLDFVPPLANNRKRKDRRSNNDDDEDGTGMDVEVRDFIVSIYLNEF